MICLLIRDFAVSQERHLTSQLAEGPLLLVQAGVYRPKVIAMDSVARCAGVTPGMTIKQTEALCPMATCYPVDETRYERIFMDVTAQLMEITDRIEPEYQPTSAVWYTDDALMISHLVAAIKHLTGISPQVGRADTKFPARVAAAVTAAGDCTSIASGEEAAFLSPYPVSLLPLDKLMTRRLPLLGIQTLGQLATLPRLAMWEQFGKHGRWVHDLAQGKDIRPLSPFKLPISLCECQHFEDGLVDGTILQRVLEKMCLQLATALDGQEAHAITLLLWLEDQSLLEYHRHPHQAIRDPLYLFRIVIQMLSALHTQYAVQQVEIRLANIRQRQPIQLSLFDEKTPIQTIDRLLPEWAYRHRDAQFYRLQLTGEDHLPERMIERRKVIGA